MSAASALMLATEASRSVAARRRLILEVEEREIGLKSCVVDLAWLLFEIYELYGIEHVIEHVLVMVGRHETSSKTKFWWGI